MTYKDALNILEKHFTGRIDAPDRPTLDDIHEAFSTLDDSLQKLNNFEKKLVNEQKIAADELDNLKIQLQDAFDMQDVLKHKLKDQRHQICEKIREKTNGIWYFVLEEYKEYFEGNRYVLSQNDFDKILGQIEKGEEVCKK